ncbi:MAG: phytanoyl-CoA dioxygenase family protein [Planctomycetes bacterium]|nr:phytanoyl-CoA dioxygenase family protein [Planctomycetota bacterium]
MLEKVDCLNRPFRGQAPAGSIALERDGHYVLRGEYSSSEIGLLRAAIEAVYDTFPPDPRDGRTSSANAAMFRYEMFNRAAACQWAIERPAVLAILEPLLGGDCHVISCTAWRNPPGNEHAPRGQEWHIDGGPHVPREEGVSWPTAIPYPVFVVATHVYLEDVRIEDGPTAVVPGSHTTGQVPPSEHVWSIELGWGGRTSEPHLVRAGDVGFFVSDVWHRRLPPATNSRGRFFLQTNYGRRDIAQRIRPTSAVNHVDSAAIARATTDRQRRLLGLHPQTFYDG